MVVILHEKIGIMKKILAEILGLSEKEIDTYSLNVGHDLSIERVYDFGIEYSTIVGTIFQPQYRVVKDTQEVLFVDFEDLILFIYNKK